jgi:hypothetical protein
MKVDSSSQPAGRSGQACGEDAADVCSKGSAGIREEPASEDICAAHQCSNPRPNAIASLCARKGVE